MKVLGYSRYNLFGGSYGVPMSVAIIRLFPEKVRSATLVGGPGISASELLKMDVPNFARALNLLFGKCKNDPKCRELYPDLESDFYHVYQKLKRDPLTLKVDTAEFRSSLFTLNSQDYINVIYWLLARETRVRYLPRLIQAFKNKEMEVIKRIIEREFGGLGSEGSRMGISVLCYDAYTHRSKKEWETAAESFPAALKEITYFLRPCEYWSGQYAPANWQMPFKSKVPAFIITGELDPMNPPEAGESFLQWFENAQHVTIPGMAHIPPSAREEDCWTAMIRDFIRDPLEKVNKQCIAEIPDTKFIHALPKWAK